MPHSNDKSGRRTWAESELLVMNMLQTQRDAIEETSKEVRDMRLEWTLFKGKLAVIIVVVSVVSNIAWVVAWGLFKYYILNQK